MVQGHTRGRGCGAEETFGILSKYPPQCLAYISTCTNLKDELIHEQGQTQSLTVTYN